MRESSRSATRCASGDIGRSLAAEYCVQADLENTVRAIYATCMTVTPEALLARWHKALSALPRTEAEFLTNVLDDHLGLSSGCARVAQPCEMLAVLDQVLECAQPQPDAIAGVAKER